MERKGAAVPQRGRQLFAIERIAARPGADEAHNLRRDAGGAKPPPDDFRDRVCGQVAETDFERLFLDETSVLRCLRLRQAAARYDQYLWELAHHANQQAQGGFI